jgi:hypothetical protein
MTSEVTEHQTRERRLAYSRSYRAANRERLLEEKRRYYQANRERRLEYWRQYRLKNMEQIRESNQRYNHANRERRLAYGRSYLAANRGRILEEKRRYHHANRDGILRRKRVLYHRKRQIIAKIEEARRHVEFQEMKAARAAWR